MEQRRLIEPPLLIVWLTRTEAQIGSVNMHLAVSKNSNTVENHEDR